MDDEPLPLADRMQRALIEHLIRSGLMDNDDIAEMCERLKARGDDDAAHEFACLMLHASAPDQATWEAERARARFHVIEGAGGKGED